MATKPKPIPGYTVKMGRGGIPIYTRVVKKPPKGTTTRPRPATPTIETPAQIEARVRKMAEDAFNRERDAVREEADRLKLQAEGRRRGMTAAYEAAAKANAGMGADVQQGWEQAAGTIQGLANTTTGGIADALAADLATQEQALSRVGAGGTGFDARSQAGVEAYRGGRLPAEYFTRLGGVGRQWMNEAGTALGARGLQEGLAAEQSDVSEIDADVLSQIKDLTLKRTGYESDLRGEMMAARADQLDAQAAAAKVLADIQNDKAKLAYQYWNAKLNAKTKQEKAQIDAIYKAELLRLKGLEVAALNAQRQAAAGLNVAKTEDILKGGTGTGTKPPSASSVSNTVVRATTAGNNAIQTVFENIWAKHPDAQVPPNWNEKRDGPYTNSPQYAAAVAWSKKQRQKSFGTIMLRVITSISPHLKAIGYSPFQIKKMAYQLVSAKVQPPNWWTTANKKFLDSLAGK